MSFGIDHFPKFFTATILNWKNLLSNDEYKNIIINSLDFLVTHKRIRVHAFVIMPNHIHLIWHIADGLQTENVQRDFLKFTAQRLRFDLLKNNPILLKEFRVDAKDRVYQFWERNPLNIDIFSETVLLQKLAYIHNNPFQSRWKLCKEPREYKYSSAAFYEYGRSEWKFLTNYK